MTSVDGRIPDRHFYDVSGENWIQTLLWFVSVKNISSHGVCFSAAGRQEGLVQTGVISVHRCLKFSQSGSSQGLA